MKAKNKILTILFVLALILGNLGINPIVSRAGTLTVPGDFKGTVTFTEEGQTMLTVTWNEVSGAEGYEVYYRCNVPGEDTWENWRLSTKTTDTTASEWIIDGCFQMKVRAYKGSAYSNFTDVITVEGGTGIISNPVIKLNATKKTIYTGNTFTLVLKNATNDVTWKSSNKKVATVTKKGVVKGVAKGTATITATSNGKKYTCTITVKKLTAVAAYKAFLTKGKMTVYNREVDIDKFIYLDIDRNGTKELIVLNPNGGLVYTFTNGKMKKLETLYTVNLGEYIDFGYNPSQKTFTVSNNISAGGSSNVYQIKNGELKLIHSLCSSGSGLTGSNNYDLDRVISDSELTSLYKKYFQGEHKKCTLYTCNVENIKKYIK